MTWCIAAVYKFTRLTDPGKTRDDIRQLAEAHGLCGTMLVAGEGINGTIAGSHNAIHAFLATLTADCEIGALAPKFSDAAEKPFAHLKVKLKPEIVTFGAPGSDPNVHVGQYVAPEDWDRLIADPDVILIDTRNSYEYAIGTFRGAIDPQTRNFREFPAYVAANLDPARHRKVAMFCTGGIRCEKATAYMLSQGFEEVYHLDGGILNYLAKVPKERSSWRGECFIFDERVSVDHDLKPGQYRLCATCGGPVDKTSPDDAACPGCAMEAAAAGAGTATVSGRAR
ncbi:MAG TPA: rhodanese-related sulfurtransferase [Hyphomicrobiaceae bacterium]|nr:rhodanese-related sulfurtransferase [Hyphomicrobiaceae bacterium]